MRHGNLRDDGIDTGVEGLLVLNFDGFGRRMERGEGQNAVLVADLHGAIEVMQQADARTAERRTGACGLDAVEGATASEGEGLREHSVLAPRQDIIECVDVLRPWPVGRCGVTGLDCEPGIPHVHEAWCKGLRFLHAGYALKAHFLDQAILKGLVGPLNPALGLRGRGADQFNSEALGHPAKFGPAIAACCVLGVDPEYPVPVTVQRKGPSMGQNMRPQRLKINTRGLGRCKAQIRQAARRIVDEDDQAATRATPLKPVMRAAVDLDQLAKPCAPLSQGVCLSTPPLSGPP